VIQSDWGTAGGIVDFGVGDFVVVVVVVGFDATLATVLVGAHRAA
jgi:hypothetical protein